MNPIGSLIGVIVTIMTCAGCTRVTHQQIVPDREGVGTMIGDACETLRRVGCTEGYPANGRTCYEHFQTREQHVVIPIACLAAASSRTAVRACGANDPQVLHVKCLEPEGG